MCSGSPGPRTKETPTLERQGGFNGQYAKDDG